MKTLIAALALLVISAHSLSAQQIEVLSLGKGRVRPDGDIGGGGPSAYGAGVSEGLLHRSFFLFNVPPLQGKVIIAATLRAFNPIYSSPDPTETYALYDLDASSVTELRSNVDPVSERVYADAGSGQIYGQRTVSSADNGLTIEVPLNGVALAALDRSRGNVFAIGGALTTLSGQLFRDELVFSNTGIGDGPGNRVSLVLSIRDPVQIALNSTRYCVGSSWNLEGSHAAPNAAIRLLGTVNDIPWEIPHWADTDANGNFSAAGTYTVDAAGKYTLSAEIEGSRSNILPVDVVKCGVRDTGPLNVGRAWPTATLLANGRVLVIGNWAYQLGNSTSVELYDPAAETWTVTGSLTAARVGYTATLLANGKVLVTGGYENTPISPRLSRSAELYDPESGTWSRTGDPNEVHFGHTATLLPNGQVLVAAGDGACCYDDPPVSELYDPGTGTWRIVGRLPYDGHLDQRATLLANGKVLLVGGIDNRESYPSLGGAALFDPATETWRTTRSPNMPRANHTATLLPSGKVLVAGGFTDLGMEVPAELYDPATETWSAGIPSTQRYTSSATLLPDGKVLLVGSISGPKALREYGTFRVYGTWRYDPDSGAWSDFVLHDGDYYTATMLQSGKVLMVGGWREGALKGTALYDGGFEIPLLTSNAATYCVGAPWTLKVTHAPVSASLQLVGVSNGSSWRIPGWGTTNEGGAFTTGGNMAVGTEGAHTLHVEIGGLWSNAIDFSVSRCQP